MRVVALEEHISLPQFAGRIPKKAREVRGWPDPADDASPFRRVQQQLQDVGDGRIDLYFSESLEAV